MIDHHFQLALDSHAPTFACISMYMYYVCSMYIIIFQIDLPISNVLIIIGDDEDRNNRSGS